MTDSAISHQVKRLENFLRIAWIDRSSARAKLTGTGRRYLEQIEPALLQIQAATEAILSATGRSVVQGPEYSSALAGDSLVEAGRCMSA